MAYLMSLPSLGRPQPSREPAAASDFVADDKRLAWLAAALRREPASEHRSRMLFRFALLNIACGAILAAGYVNGLVDMVIEADKTGLSIGIFAIFVVGLAICGAKVWRTSRDLDHVHDFDSLRPSRAAEYLAQLRGTPGGGRSVLAASLRLKLSHRIGLVRQIAGSLVLLGLIGTVLGFIIALSGVDPEQAGDVSAIGPMVSTLIEGMSTALYTTLVGAVLNLWLMANHRLLSSGTVNLITALVEFGERHARS